MEQLQPLKQWYSSLAVKEQWMVTGTSILIVLTLLYLTIWEPIKLDLQAEQQRQQSQQEIILWMQQSAEEVRSLRRSGGSTVIRDRNKPVTLVVEQALNTAGLKPSVNKIESSGNKGTRVILKDAPFNQILVWLNTLASYNGIHVVSANMERAGKAGRADARLTFERP